MLTLLIGFSATSDDHGGVGEQVDGTRTGDETDARTDDATGDARTDDPPAGDSDDGDDAHPGTDNHARPPVSVDEGDGGVVLSVGGETRQLTPAEATRLRTALGEAVADRWAFVNTVGERRPDGSYVVRRRGSETTGNSVVFDSFRALCRLAGRLPATVDAETVGREREGVTGSRRHLVVWHLAEHPALDYRVASRSPLRARSDGDATGAHDTADPAGGETTDPDESASGETATGDD